MKLAAVIQSLQKCDITLPQICLILAVLVTSVTIKITWISILLLTCLLLTFLVSKMKKLLLLFCQDKVVFDLNVNPFKGKKGLGYLTAKKETEIARAISDLVVYDADSVSCLRRFKALKMNSECIFAKRAKLWGSLDFIEECSLEENIKRIIPTFYKFTMAFQDLSLDAFLIELPGHLYGQNIQVFGDAMRRVLLTLRKADLERQKLELLKTETNSSLLQLKLNYLVEDPHRWNRMSWVFEFNKTTFFITSFAPFYPESNSRFAFGCEHSYILFQPEIAFAIHDLPEDTAETNWSQPRTVRDKIRVAFRDAGREYEVPKKLHEPMVHEVVKKVHANDEQLSWWLPS